MKRLDQHKFNVVNAIAAPGITTTATKTLWKQQSNHFTLKFTEHITICNKTFSFVAKSGASHGDICKCVCVCIHFYSLREHFGFCAQIRTHSLTHSFTLWFCNFSMLDLCFCVFACAPVFEYDKQYAGCWSIDWLLLLLLLLLLLWQSDAHHVNYYWIHFWHFSVICLATGTDANVWVCIPRIFVHCVCVCVYMRVCLSVCMIMISLLLKYWNYYSVQWTVLFQLWCNGNNKQLYNIDIWFC